ncbi:MAG: alkaline phosphatase family protein [Chitinophagales bacterium]
MKLVLVTFDGCRWEEIFRGADRHLAKQLVGSKLDTNLIEAVSKGNHEEKRAALAPFFWNTIAKQGMLIGNRDKGSTLALTNPHLFSYPGYSELFCGYVDRHVNSNNYPDNPNKGMVDFLCETDTTYRNDIVAFSNWSAFSRILNSNRNGVCMYDDFVTGDSVRKKPHCYYFKNFETTIPGHSPYSEKDTLVYRFAKEYLHRFHPKVAFIGFDETDHMGHVGNYPGIIGAIRQFDSYMEDLWNALQADSFYKDQTILAVTCDHGRGGWAAGMWHWHGMLWPGSRFTWLAVIGPGVKATGEQKGLHIAYHNQIAGTLMKLMGKDYKIAGKHVGRPIKEVIEE